jgi:gamma-glutamylcysteine synthetase
MRIPLASIIAALAVAGTTLPAQTITAYKTGERTTGQTKQCYYDGLGNEYTKTISSIALCPLSIQVTSRTPSPAPTPTQTPRPTITAYKTGEETTGGTKQCYYEGLGNRYTKTVQSHQLCPLSIAIER